MEAKIKAIRFEVPGNPVPKGRPRFSFKSGHAYTPRKTKIYEELIAKEYQKSIGEILPYSPLKIDVIAVFEIPHSYSKKKKESMIETGCTKRADIDNIVKSVLDALNGIAYIDDSCVVEIYGLKKWGTEPKTEVVIHYEE